MMLQKRTRARSFKLRRKQADRVISHSLCGTARSNNSVEDKGHLLRPDIESVAKPQ